MSGAPLEPAKRTLEQAQADIAAIRAGAIVASKSMACTAYVHNKDKRIVGWIIDANLFENAAAPLSGVKEIARGYLANAPLVKALEKARVFVHAEAEARAHYDQADASYAEPHQALPLLEVIDAALKAAKGEA